MKNIQIYDTSLRDGTQGEGVAFSVLDKLQIAQRLDEVGIDFIEGGYPLSNDKDAEFFRRAKELNFRHSRICSFGMTRRKGIKAQSDPGMESLLRSESPVVTIVGKTWDFHVFQVLEVSLDENLDLIADTIQYLCEHGREVIYDAEHFFDGWSANPQYAARTIQTAAAAGASHVVLCDTNGGSMPDLVAKLTREAARCIQGYKAEVGIHCHNDCELAVANSLAAVEAGAVQVQGTVNGIGERCGNADLISVIANLGIKKRGFQVLGGRELTRLTELSRFVYEMANMPFRSNQPFVGKSAFAHKGGMHVHAVSKAARSYEHIDPAAVGNERRVLLSELSGRSNVAALTQRLDSGGDKTLLNQILRKVVELENRGYQFEAALASFDLMVRRFQGTFQPHFQILKYHVTVEKPEDGQLGPLTEATVKIAVGNELRHEVAEGDGPVNALDAALRKALGSHFPELHEMRLVDYRVRVVNEEAGTAARIRVVIESTDGKTTWGTVGVSENIIEASWLALADAVEYHLSR
jgi:2-isopropylmalate synthase